MNRLARLPVLVFLCVSLGVLLAPHPIPITLGLGVVVLLVPRVGPWIGVVLLTCTWTTARLHDPPVVRPASGSIVRLEGWVVDRRPTGLIVRAHTPESIAGFECYARVDRDVPVGARVDLTGRFVAPSPARNPGDFDALRWSNARGRLGSLMPAVVEEVEPPGASLGTLRAHVRDGLRFDDPLLDALVLGTRNDDDRFARLGIAHLLAISGFHVALLGGMGGLLVRLAGDRPRLELIVVLAIVCLYAWVVPSRSPVLRATMMTLAARLPEAMGRRWSRVHVLLWCATGILLWRPDELHALGFQLSFGLTLALLTLHAPVRELLFPKIRGSLDVPPPWREAWSRTVAAAVLCWALSTPWLASRTGIVSLAGVPLTIVASPLCALMLFGAVVDVALRSVGWGVPGLRWGASGLVDALGVLDSIPWTSWRVGPVPRAWAIAATAWIVVSIRGVPRRWFIGGGLSLACWIVIVRLSGVESPRLDVLDVGNATCMLVRVPGETMLYDCGIEVDDLERILRHLGVDHLDTLVVTHANLDHDRGVSGVVERYRPARVLTSARVVRERGLDATVVRAGDVLSFGSGEMHVLGPGRPHREANDESVVLRLEVGGWSVLLTGDIEEPGIESLLAGGWDLDSTVMELPHHGSWNEGAAHLVSHVSPEVVVVSGHRPPDPRWETVLRGIETRRTGLGGMITVDHRVKTWIADPE